MHSLKDVNNFSESNYYFLKLFQRMIPPAFSFVLSLA